MDDVVLGRGSRSVVWRLTDGRARKRFDADVPAEWATYEQRFMSIAAALGAPAPRTIEAGRDADGNYLDQELVDGPMLWDGIGEPAGPDAARAGRRLADVQAALFELPVSMACPRQGDRVRAKLLAVVARFGERFAPALDLVPPEPSAYVLCHGDLHPKNVLGAGERPGVVDWFDLCRGSRVGEVARTVVVMSTGPTPVPAPMLAGYLERVGELGALDDGGFDRWVTVQRVARLAEGLDDDLVEEVAGQLA